MNKIGFIGWRGMVGSVLLERMRQEGDFEGTEPVFFSTSNAGGAPPEIGVSAGPLVSAYDLDALAELDAIVSCQGGDFTAEVHPALRRAGWEGYWIDAASTLRMNDDAVIVLDPINREIIDRALARGVRDLVGGNCTVSLMLMAMAGPIREGWVSWISSMTYQAASGAGARAMTELVRQMATLSEVAKPLLASPATSALDLDRAIDEALDSTSFPKAELGVPLAASLIPWIDRAVEEGQTREEKKGFEETNKLLERSEPLPVDGICVRVAAMRSHSQALTVKLTKDVPLEEIEACIRESHPWAKLVENTMDATRAELTPAAVTGTLDIAIGRLRKMRMGPEYLAAFTVGDQLLWGAAEPLRRALRIVRGVG